MARNAIFFISRLLFAASLGVLANSCFLKQKNYSPIVARIGKSVLTLDDLHASMPPAYRDQVTREQCINYAKQWIDNEILYQEALRRKLHKEAEIGKRIDKMRRDFLCAEVLSRASPGQNVTISDSMIVEYFEKNKGNFIRDKDAIKYVEIAVDNEAAAWRVRNAVTPGNIFDLARQFSKLPVQEPDETPFIAVDQLPPELAELLSTTRIGGTTSPIQTIAGYSVFRILDKQKKGTQCELAEVRDEVLTQLSAEIQRNETEHLLSELRLKMDIEYNFGAIPSAMGGDTLAH
jgi:hypothetical protein